MKKLLAKSISLVGLLSASVLSNTAVAADDGALMFQNDKAKLTCTTPVTCGNYADERPIKVYRRHTYEMRVYWKQNVPTGVAGGSNKGYTIGAACPVASLNTNLTATWYITNNRPTHAVVTNCDGSISEFDVTYTYDLPNCLSAYEDALKSNDGKSNPSFMKICF